MRVEAEYAGCILVNYKLRSKYKMGGLVSAGPVRSGLFAIFWGTDDWTGPRSLQNPKDRDRNRLKPVFFGFNQLQSILFINWLTTGFSRK